MGISNETNSGEGYPNTPGHAKFSETSREAARIIEPSVSGWRREILGVYDFNYLNDGRGLTPDEAKTFLLSLNKYYVRSRCSELKALGYLVATDEKVRKGRFTYHVLRITEKGLAVLMRVE